MKEEIQKHPSRILIVDDEADVGRLLKRFLERFFASVQTVEDLSGAEAAIKNNPPDIIILDNNLPDGSGVEVIPVWKKAAPNLQIIAISAMSHLHDRALENGARVFLEKPLTLPVLLDHLYKACATPE